MGCPYFICVLDQRLEAFGPATYSNNHIYDIIFK